MDTMAMLQKPSPFLVILYSFITTEGEKYPTHIQHSFQTDIPTKNFPDRNHPGCQQDLKSLN